MLTKFVSCLFQRFFTNVFNGCYAILMFIVVIFFLIYGVEVYFKVKICLCILINVMFGIFVICREAQLCLRSGKFKFSLHRFVEVFYTREKAAFRWGLCRSKPLPRRLHLRVCPRLFPLPPRITLTMLTIKIQKKRKSQCISWKKRQAIILVCFLSLEFFFKFLIRGFLKRRL